MALKNLFDMVKADKYTADGREALIKAQEAETEDATRRTYQIGEISQATGLQKTANGWVKPKNGAGRNHGTEQKKRGPGAIHTPGKGSVGIDKMKEAAEKGLKGQELKEFMTGSKKQEEPKNVHGAEVDKIYERQLKRIKELKAKGFTDEQIDNDKIIKQTKEDMKNVGKKPESKPAAQEEIGKFFTKFEDVQSAYDAGRQTFPEGGYKIYNTPQGYKVVDDPKTQQRMEEAGYEIEADVPADTKPPRYPGDTPEKRQNANRQRGEQLAKPAADEEKRGLQQWTEVIQGYKDKSVIEQRKSLQEKYDEFEEDLKDFDRRKLAPSEYARRINQQNFLKGALKAIDEEMEARGMDPAPRTSVPDAAPSLSEIVDRVYNIGEISEKTGLQKTAQGWRPVKKGAAGKTSRASKEEAIRKDLGLTAGEDMSRFSDEQIESMYQKTQKTPEQQKADFDKSKIGQAVNKGRQEFAAEKTRQKELASKTNAIGLPKENKPSADWKETPSGRTNMIRTPEGTATVTWNKEANGEEWYGFSTVKNNKMKSSDTHYKTKAEAQLAAEKELKGENEPAGRDFRSELEKNPKGAYDFEKTVEKSIPLSAGDKEVLGTVKSFMREEGTDYKDALKSVATGLVNGNKLHGDWYPEKEKSLLKIAKAVGMDEEVKSYVKTMAKGYDFGYSEDAAPRVLTGDTRIRVRKEKAPLTGDTRIKVRK